MNTLLVDMQLSAARSLGWMPGLVHVLPTEIRWMGMSALTVRGFFAVAPTDRRTSSEASRANRTWSCRAGRSGFTGLALETPL
ncbi:hypothetical protein [Hydrogenophaga sp. RWCD_12]|uniref:hypothetical protein n=1 Tax=Hydrogenophaga sp. RWCD_12 TaxID=3391190 RepID=UPI00398478B0